MNDGWGYGNERRIITCCKGCPDRHPGCHGHCNKYQQQLQTYHEQKQAAAAKAPPMISKYSFEQIRIGASLKHRRRK